MKEKKVRLDKLLVNLGYFQELKTAQSWIMSGKIVVNGAVADKPGALYRPSDSIHLRDRPLRFASRGGYKLEHALDRFGLDVRGLVCLDAGASTGGFTDCLLQHDAIRVYAIDAGYGQLRGKLSTDLRVVNRERTNIGDVTVADLHPPIDFASADLSYLTLRKAVPIVARLFTKPQSMVFLMKPLYEGLPQTALNDRPALAEVVKRLFNDLADIGFAPNDACASPILGSRGATELLLRFSDVPPPAPETVAERALADLDSHPPLELSTILDCA